MNRKILLLIALTFTFAMGNAKNADDPVDIQQEGDLTVYYPHFKRIDLVTGTMPSQNEKNVIFCCEAAFTGELLDEFSHSNIAGHHVSGGKFYKGFKCGPNNGVFTWSKKSGWHFYNYSLNNSEGVLKTAAENGGMGFGQSLLIHDGKEFTGCFKSQSQNRYRALCELRDNLCIIECSKKMSFGDFKSGLKKLGVKEAIYLDMGTGWNYSWYRKSDGTVVEIFPIKGKYCTNWITFYSE